MRLFPCIGPTAGSNWTKVVGAKHTFMNSGLQQRFVVVGISRSTVSQVAVAGGCPTGQALLSRCRIYTHAWVKNSVGLAVAEAVESTV